MAGHREGGLKAARTVYAYYGPDFYKQIGAKGGKVSRGGGFTDPVLASVAGKKGGAASRRRKRSAPINDIIQP